MNRITEKKRNSLFCNVKELADAAGISEVTLRHRIHDVEKIMGFKEGDLQALVNMTLKGISQRQLHPCPGCGQRTTADLCNECKRNS